MLRPRRHAADRFRAVCRYLRRLYATSRLTEWRIADYFFFFYAFCFFIYAFDSVFTTDLIFFFFRLPPPADARLLRGTLQRACQEVPAKIARHMPHDARQSCRVM